MRVQDQDLRGKKIPSDPHEATPGHIDLECCIVSTESTQIRSATLRLKRCIVIYHAGYFPHDAIFENCVLLSYSQVRIPISSALPQHPVEKEKPMNGLKVRLPNRLAHYNSLPPNTHLYWQASRRDQIPVSRERAAYLETLGERIIQSPPEPPPESCSPTPNFAESPNTSPPAMDAA